jgi:hypothetical protein
VADGFMRHYVNGALLTTASALTTFNATYTSQTYDEIYFTQISNNTEPADYFYYGPTLIDDSRCRLIVSTESSWNTSAAVTATRDFCVPSAWDDGSITALLRKGIHSTLSGKSLYVVKGDGSAVKIGSFS